MSDNIKGKLDRYAVFCIDAYGVAVKNGFKGSAEEWLASLKGEAGRGIIGMERTDGEGIAGTFDTYTIYFSDGDTFEFKVYNGANGTGGSSGGSAGATFYPHVDADGNLTWTNNFNLENPETVNIKGPKGDKGDSIKGDKGDKGDSVKGDPGVSVTHSWKGTTLTITSASGTSSVDLKGEKGDPGQSIKGDPGKTPVKGEDYFTTDDVATIVKSVLDALDVAEEASF